SRGHRKEFVEGRKFGCLFQAQGLSPLGFLILNEDLHIARACLTELPPVRLDGVPWRLPLCDATALDLALALTSDSEERRIDRLAGALAADAALAIWSRMQAASGEGGERRPGAVRAIPQLAAWLARQLGALLRWPETATAGAFTPQQCEQFAELQF